MLHKSIIIVLLTLCVGCASMVPSPPPYDVVVRNGGVRELNDTEVFFDGFRFRTGILPGGISKTYMSHRGTIPDKATCMWRSPDGVHHLKWKYLDQPTKDQIPTRKLVPTIHDDNTLTVSVEETPQWVYDLVEKAKKQEKQNKPAGR